MAAWLSAVTAASALVGCTASEPAAQPNIRASSSVRTSPSASATPEPATSASASTSTAPSPPTASQPPQRPVRFDAAAAMADVRQLAGQIGPRLATGPAYRRAGRLVERRFAALGYDVRRAAFRVPPGDSWGVPVEGGRSFNVIAEPADLDPSKPHVVLGAHLDTVAVSPGAEDNASGVAVLLELARLTAASPPRLPVVWIAFGAEEPRGTSDDMHHFGSQHHVRRLTPQRRRATVAMVSLDRVGVGHSVPVCTGPLSPDRVQRSLLEVAARIEVPAHPCDNTASDHWSFEKAGVTVARVGSTSYAAYHSDADRPGVVGQAQLGRVGAVVWAWLQ